MKVTTETLARWWCELNTYRWPKEFGPLPPDANESERIHGAWRAIDVIAGDVGLERWRKIFERTGTTP